MSDQDQRYADVDEIDLRDLIIGLWDGKSILAGAVALGLSVGAFTSVLLPDRFSFSIQIQPITTIEEDAYAELNASGLFQVRQNVLLSVFVEVLDQRGMLIGALDDVGYLSIEDFADREDYHLALRKIAFGFRLSPPTTVPLQGSRPERFAELTGFGKDEALLRRALEQAFEEAEAEVRDILRQRFEQAVNQAERRRLFRIEEYNLALNNARADYEIEIAARLAFLREQAAIARRIDLARGSALSVQIGEAREFAGRLEDQQPYFALGYEAIEQEIENIESREFGDSFVEGSRQLVARIRSAEQDPTIERALSAFESTPLAMDAGFQAVQVELARMNVERQFSPQIVIGLAVVVGLFAGLGVLLVRSALRRKNF